jgi:hypothetical protein
MKNGVLKALCASSLCLTMSGCSTDLLFAFSPEEKINIAIPVTAAVAISKATLLEQSSAPEKKDIEREYAAKMKLRALNCGKGVSPSIFSSKEDIQKQIGNATCFVNYDTEVERWLGFRRVNLLASKPPVHPIPAKAPAFVLSSSFIQSAQFADNAGVVLLETQKSIQVVDVETSKILYEEQKNSSQFGKLSPNGRVFNLSADGRTRFKDAETGAALLELPNAVGFQWLDNDTGVFHRENIYGKSVFFDIKAGREIESKGIQESLTVAGKAPGSDNQYVIISNKGAAQVQLTASGTEREVKLVQEKPVSNTSYAFNTSGTTADGKISFSVRGESLSLINLQTLEQETVAFNPVYLQTATPSADPDKILLKGFVSGLGSPAPYVFSIKDRTLAKVDVTKLLSDRLFYIPSLKKQATIADSKVAILNELPTEPAIPMDKMVSDALEQANQKKLEMAKQMEAMQAMSQLGAQSRAVPGGPIYEPRLAAAPASGIMAELAKNAQIEAIGVYQGANGPRRADRTGDVEVRIKKSAKPVFLVLSSYEKVQWRLVVENGAQLNGVLVSGYNQSQVVGAGSARVTVSGNQYAYQKNTPQFAALNGAVMMQLGKPIGEFQGRYDGTSFTVGGS